MIDPGELKWMRLRVLAFLFAALSLTLVGASTSLMISDAAYTLATLMIVGMTGWMVRWADLASFVCKLISIRSMVYLLINIVQLLRYKIK